MCWLLWDIVRQEDPLFTAKLFLIGVKLANPWFGKIVLLGHLERFGARHEDPDTVSGALH